MTDAVTTSLEAGVLTISFARPEKKNAITDAMYKVVADALEDAGSNDQVRVVLFRGEGDSFSAGNDINDFVAIAMGGGGGMNVFRVLKALAHFDKPVVAAVKGAAVGIGTTLLLNSDLVYVAEDARLSTPFVNLALAPEAASTILLPLAIGHQRAFSMFALGEVVSGSQAAAWGIANAALPAAEVEAAALKAAQELAKRAPRSLQLTKRLMRDAARLWSQMERENEAFGSQLTSPEAREAFTAFAERRPPDFSKVS
ncbi:MAG: enoyl-CoA hydratase/isomerase family protein [Caulobacteraceae bacterium]|nr:enoyl-CoA hydratase/isomerase family protein [Caulobacteraceae bacterium]